MSYLEKINSPADLKKLSMNELEIYAQEVRAYIIDVVNKNGGHLSSNLGSVDFTIALHYVFDCPRDKIIFDVGHQSYAHKIITGRRNAFVGLRVDGGISGFENMRESDCDAFSTGHSSTSLSVGLGYARARDLAGENYNVISVIGDGALTGGMSYEALNNIGESGTRMIIILNDNTMSISKNVGAMSKYLGKLRLSKRYRSLKTVFKRGIDGIPLIGPALVKVTERTKSWVKRQLITNKMFEQLGIKYYGAFDGHNIRETVQILTQIKSGKQPVVLHLITNKGNGLYEAEKDPEKYHGVEGSAENMRKYSSIVSDKIIELADRDGKVVAVTAAMLSGTGLAAMHEKYPSRCFDVGIAEQHAVSMCAGLAAAGMKPYFAVYSSFLQRAYDQVLHDVCLNRLPVRFLIDRAGAIGADGVTHQGLFDISYLRQMPYMTILSPKDGNELEKMLDFSLTFDGPLAIRYPKGYREIFPSDAPFSLGKWETLRESRNKAIVLAVGNRMIDLASRVDCSIVNVNSISPIDTAMLSELNRSGNLLITLEDGIISGGFGESVSHYLRSVGQKCKLIGLGFENSYCDKLTVKSAFASAGLTEDNLRKIIASHTPSGKKTLE